MRARVGTERGDRGEKALQVRVEAYTALGRCPCAASSKAAAGRDRETSEMANIPNVNPDSRATPVMDAPDKIAKVRDLFGIDSDMEIPVFSEADERVPDLDPAYVFDPDTTLAICAGFAKNRRVMVQGYHGTGKSTHIEQVAARLNWPTIRINLDAHISRIDLVGRDAIVLKDGQQVTEFREGLLPRALRSEEQTSELQSLAYIV